MPPMKRRSRGFTLYELMITVALAAVIFGIGVPAFRNFALNGRLSGAANEMLVTLVATRNEAVRRQARTSFCPSNDPTAESPVCDEEATAGFVSFVDVNGDCQRDDGEEVISSFIAHDDVEAGNNILCIGYSASGFRIPTAGTPANAHIIFCDKRGVTKVADASLFSFARGVEIVATGRAASSRLQADLELWAEGDNPVTCPNE
jgi:prepilin-type N-terminal cleavage/methylation domain-containing protein